MVVYRVLDDIGALVVVAGLEDFQVLVDDAVDKSMLIGDSAGPRSGESVLEWFWLSDAFVWAAACFVDESVDALEDRAIGCLPVLVVIPRLR